MSGPRLREEGLAVKKVVGVVEVELAVKEEEVEEVEEEGDGGGGGDAPGALVDALEGLGGRPVTRHGATARVSSTTRASIC
jgi:hypothetical protein